METQIFLLPDVHHRILGSVNLKTSTPLFNHKQTKVKVCFSIEIFVYSS